MAHSREQRRQSRAYTRHLTWANALRVLGAFGFLHELLIYEGDERAQILVLCGTLLLGPTFVGLDRGGQSK